jgi:hypothetical protein
MLDEFDALAALETHAPDFHCTGWTVGLHNSRLGQLHPDLVCQSAFGDPLVNALCPSQPEVRAYLVAPLRPPAFRPTGTDTTMNSN